MDISGASAIVTGGASGLGEATAKLLAERGARVVIADLDRQEEKAKDVVATTGGLFAPCDVTDPDQVIAAVEAAKELGPLRVLVNCAGIGWPQRTIGKDGQYTSAHDLDIFTKVIQINLIGRSTASASPPPRSARPSRSTSSVSGARSSTRRRSPPTTARSVRPRTPRRRPASSG